LYSAGAATYTPLVLIPLRDSDLAGQLLMRVWLAAAAGVGKTLCWPQAPKQLSAIIYVVMGHMVLPYLPIMAQAVEPPVVMLVAAGGVMYTLGALIYAAGWPNPFPQWFGFHEVFHALVIMASICHFSAIYSSVVKMSHLPGPLPVL
jgi:hemolysin III